MNNFEITVLKKEKENILIFMKTSEPPFDFLEEMETALTDIHYKGNVVIDELLHSGNNDERFITGYFDGNRFESGEFNFKLVMKMFSIFMSSNLLIFGYLCFRYFI